MEKQNLSMETSVILRKKKKNITSLRHTQVSCAAMAHTHMYV